MKDKIEKKKKIKIFGYHLHFTQKTKEIQWLVVSLIFHGNFLPT